MALVVLNQGVFCIDAQTVLPDEPAHSLFLGHIRMRAYHQLHVVMELPVEKPLEFTVDNPGRPGRYVVPVEGILMEAALSAVGQVYQQVSTRVGHAPPHPDVPPLQRPLGHGVPHGMVEIEIVRNHYSTRFGMDIKLPARIDS